MRALVIALALSCSVPAAQTVEGRVVNSVTGAGIAGVKVRLMPVEDGEPYSTTTDEEGRFRIADVAEGAYNLRYLAPGFGAPPDRDRQIPTIAVSSGAQPVRLEAKLQPFGKLSGRVLDGAGRPVPNAGVWLFYEPRWCASCVPLHGSA